MKIIFMGTPSFAVPALEALIASKHEIVAVYTKEPKPAGRGYNEVKSQIHQLAEKANLKILTPKNFRTEESVAQFKELDADITVVVAYGLILPKSILDGTRMGAVNIHPSLLPRWRGAAPLQHTILAGDKRTAVCIMQMDEGMDTGDIILKEEFEVDTKYRAFELHDKCSQIGADLVIKTLELFANNKVVRTPQTEEGLIHAHKLNKEHEKIDWNKSAFAIDCQIRTFTPRPGAYFIHNNEIIKILEAEVVEGNGEPGKVLDNDLLIACGEGAIRPLLLQREGKKSMYRDAFLRGYKIEAGNNLGL